MIHPNSEFSKIKNGVPTILTGAQMYSQTTETRALFPEVKLQPKSDQVRSSCEIGLLVRT